MNRVYLEPDILPNQVWVAFEGWTHHDYEQIHCNINSFTNTATLEKSWENGVSLVMKHWQIPIQNREKKEPVEFGNQLHTYLKLTLPSPYTALDWWWKQDASAPHSPSLTAKRSCKGSCCRSVSPPAKLDLFQHYVRRPLVRWCCWNVFKDGIICEVSSFCSCLCWLVV